MPPLSYSRLAAERHGRRLPLYHSLTSTSRFIDTPSGPKYNNSMQRTLLALLAIALLSTTSPSVAQETPKPTTASTPATVVTRATPLQIAQGPLFAQLYGSCTGEVAPTVAIIAGGVAVYGIKPVDAADNLDKQLDAIRKYVKKPRQAGPPRARRTLKNPAFNGSSDTGPPFEIVQRLHVELPVTAPVDTVLQRLLELGLDRFGETVLATNNRREEAVLFRIGNLDSALHEMQNRCIGDAWKNWCATAPPTTACKSDAPPSNFQLANFSARSDEEVCCPDQVRAIGRSPSPAARIRGRRATCLETSLFILREQSS